MTRVIDYLIGILAIVIIPASLYILVMGGVIWTDIILKLLTKEYSFEQWKQDLKYMFLCLLLVITFFWVDTAILNQFITTFVNVDMFSTKLTVSALLIPNVKSINTNIYKLTGYNLFDGLKSVFNFYKKTKKNLTDED